MVDQGHKPICIIPARGGSKRIPRKNIRIFAGKPMIAHSIGKALESNLFSVVAVSTDDNEIADISSSYGAVIPFLRPAELSDDHTGTTEVIGHATSWLLDRGLSFPGVCCLYPTAPLLMCEDLSKAWKLFSTQRWNYVFSATDFSFPIFRSFEDQGEKGLRMFFPEHFPTRSQDLPRAWHDAGQFYFGTPRSWMEGKKIFDKDSTIVPLPRWRVQDIDTEDDWIRAEWVYRAMAKDGNRE